MEKLAEEEVKVRRVFTADVASSSEVNSFWAPGLVVEALKDDYVHLDRLYIGLDAEMLGAWSGMKEFTMQFMAAQRGPDDGPLRDLLPLPLPQHAELTKSTKRGAKDAKRFREFAGTRACQRMMVWGLNLLYCPPVGDGAWARLQHNANPTRDQERVLKSLWVCAAKFLRQSERTRGPFVWLTSMGSSGHYGHSLQVACPLQADLLDIPDEGGGVVCAAELATGVIREMLLNPSLMELPLEERPLEVVRPRVHCTDVEFLKVAERTAKASICDYVPVEEVYMHNGKPLLHGAFGLKKEKQNAAGQCVMRLIIHLAALNALLKKPDQGESGKLPFVGDLVNISLVAGEVLYHFGEDLSVCFYLFRLPAVWRTRMCLNKRIWGPDVGKARGWYYLALTVVPMGWSWAVEVIEHIHCKLGEQAGLPTEAMMTIASGLPPDIQNIFAFYIDNFDELLRLAFDFPVLGASEWQKAMRRIYASWKLPVNLRKTEEGTTELQMWGAMVDGIQGLVGASPAKLTRLALELAAILACPTVSELELRHVIGSYCFVGLFNRLLYSAMEECFPFLDTRAFRTKDARIGPGKHMRRELFLMLCLLPMAFADLRLKFSTTLWSTDASCKGGGIVRAQLENSQVVQLLAVAQTRGGSPYLASGDIRFLKAPELSIDASRLSWANVLAVQWAKVQHINILEAQAVFILARLLGRNCKSWNSRTFLLVDSQVVKHAMIKGRSSSRLLNGVLRGISAIMLASGSRFLVFWTKTEYNAADGLSRLDLQSFELPWEETLT